VNGYEIHSIATIAPSLSSQGGYPKILARYLTEGD